jgi:4-amino-4-deoxy-L-arabinose transferase-like glycosyltransferase
MARPQASTSSIIFAALLAFTVLPYFVGLGASSLWDSNEAFYAETPREMAERGDYINPSFNYQPRFNKPPLSYWVVALSYKLSGVSEAAERIPIAFAALVMIGIAFGLGRLLYSTEAGLIAAFAMANSPRFFMFSRRIMIDVYLAMFLGLALLFFVLAEAASNAPGRSNKRRLFLILSYSAIGLGILTKGPVAVLLPAVTLAAYLAATRGFSRVREMMIPAGLAVILVIVVPWYAAIYWQHGWSYIEAFILRDNFSRYTQPVWGPRRGALFYAAVVMGDFFPWSVVLLPALFYAAAGKLRQCPVEDRNQSEVEPSKPPLSAASASPRYDLVLLFWIATVVMFFSLSSNKEDLYILPIYPAGACLVGGMITRAWQARGGMLRVADAALAVMACLVAFGGAAAAYLFGGLNQSLRLAGARMVGVAAVAGGLAALVAVVTGKRRFAVPAVSFSIATVLWIFAVRTLPDFERFRPIRPLCDQIIGAANAESLVGYYKLASPSMVFYLRRPVFECYDEDALKAMLGSEKTIYCVIASREYDAIKSQLPARTYVLASRAAFQVKLHGILDQDQPPQVLLITNKGGSSKPE